MNKYPLIGASILAVVLLVLGSLSNVVGYQSVKSSGVNDSPLFSVRTQRATNQQTNSITSQYLGMGQGNLLGFPMRDNQIEMFKKIIESIKKMNDKTFEQFTILCIQKVRQDNTLSDLDPHEIKQILYALRTQPNKINFTVTSPTIWEHSICNWIPGCAFFNTLGIIFLVIFVIYSVIIFILNSIFPSIGFGCTIMCTVNYGGTRNICR
jgi:hypothetical protein